MRQMPQGAVQWFARRLAGPEVRSPYHTIRHTCRCGFLGDVVRSLPRHGSIICPGHDCNRTARQVRKGRYRQGSRTCRPVRRAGRPRLVNIQEWTAGRSTIRCLTPLSASPMGGGTYWLTRITPRIPISGDLVNGRSLYDTRRIAHCRSVCNQECLSQTRQRASS